MTFQEAQARFSGIVASIDASMTSGQLVEKQRDLQNLLASLPNTPEFDRIAAAIGELSPKLVGQVTQAVVRSIQSRDTALKAVAVLLAGVAEQADADSRTLSFEKPRLVVAALTQSVAMLKEVRAAAEARRFEEAASKADAVAALLEQVQASIRTG